MRVWLAFLAFLFAFIAVPVSADDNRPLTIAVQQEETSGAWSVTWKIPGNVAAAFLPDVLPPAACLAAENTRNWSDALGHWRQQQWSCPLGLAGRGITIDYPAANPGLATIARFHMADLPTQTILLQPGEATLMLPTAAQAQTSAGTFAEFVQLGFAHIWEGLDHLLFVAGLIIIAGTWRRILVTVTGFTLAHSVTLALAALDLVLLPIRAVEAVIALSIIFLAVEIVKARRDTLTWRRPVAVAAAFGLLHGFGFAAVLREVGLPDQGLLTALFSFNIGIELGQVIFAGVLFAIGQIGLRAAPQFARSSWCRKGLGYGLGIVAAYWLFERLLG